MIGLGSDNTSEELLVQRDPRERFLKCSGVGGFEDTLKNLETLWDKTPQQRSLKSQKREQKITFYQPKTDTKV